MYIKKSYDLGQVVQVEKDYPGNFGAPGQPRSPKRERTPEEVEKTNERNKAKKLQRILLANFNPGDWHLTLTYEKEKRPGTAAEAKKELSRFLDKLRKQFRKAGIPFKWVAVTEIGSKGAAHHHLVLENIRSDLLDLPRLIQKLWTKGHPKYSSMYEEGDFEGLADYLAKGKTKEEVDGVSYSHSRNLIIPKPKKEKAHARRWASEPKAPKGYYLEKGSLVNGINAWTGFPYQRYTLRRINTGDERAKAKEKK